MLISNVKCCPDSVISVEVDGYLRVLFFEYETGADGSPQRVVAKKHKGYAQLQASGLFDVPVACGDHAYLMLCLVETSVTGGGDL